MTFSVYPRKLKLTNSAKHPAPSAANTETELEPFVERLLSCNEPPTDEERAVIYHRAQDVKAELNHAICQKSTAGAPLASHSLQKHTELLHIYQNLARGFRDLPTEVLESIFQHTLDLSLSRHLALAYIQQTCRRWRDVAVSFPNLWSQLPDVSMHSRDDTTGATFDNIVKTPEEARQLKHAITTYLGLSWNNPLTFRFHLPVVEFRQGVPGDLLDILSLLALHSRRWAHVTLVVSLGVLQVASQIAGRLPILHTLVITIEGSDWNGESAISLFSDCPSLRHVEATLHGPIDETKLVIPWSQLSTFRRRCGVDRSGEYNFVQNENPGQEDIEIYVQGNAPYITQHITRHQSWNITVFTVACDAIGGRGAEVARCLRQELTLPSLTSLSVIAPVTTLSDIKSFIERSTCPLRSIQITVFDNIFPTGAGGGDLSQILLLCPDLEVLEYGLLHTEDIKNLTIDASNPSTILVPKLHTLTVRVIIEWSSQFWRGRTHSVALTAMAKSRTSNGDSPASVAPLSVTLLFLREPLSRRAAFHDLEYGGLYPQFLEMDGKAEKWHSELYKIACIEGPTETPGFGGVYFKPSYHAEGKKIHNLLKELEEHPMTKADLVVLQKYQIPVLIERCASVPSDWIPCSAKYRTSQRLKDLYAKWKPSFIAAEASHVRRWAYKGTSELVFVPEDSELRNDPWLLATGLP